jgi:hypothetical protein
MFWAKESRYGGLKLMVLKIINPLSVSGARTSNPEIGLAPLSISSCEPLLTPMILLAIGDRELCYIILMSVVTLGLHAITECLVS